MFPPGGRCSLTYPPHICPAVAVQAGRGKLLFTALPLEPATGELYQYKLFLLDAISETFALQPAFASTDLGVFVDWGYHVTEDPATLAARLTSLAHPARRLQRLVRSRRLSPLHARISSPPRTGTACWWKPGSSCPW